MLFGELLKDTQKRALHHYNLGAVLVVPIEELGSWVRNNVQIVLCGFEHERDAHPGRFFEKCRNKHLNIACGHTYSISALMTTIQTVIAQVCETSIDDVRSACGDPSFEHNRSIFADQFWASFYGDTPKDKHRELVPNARLEQSFRVSAWSRLIHGTLCAFEEVVFVKNLEKRLSPEHQLN